MKNEMPFHSNPLVNKNKIKKRKKENDDEVYIRRNLFHSKTFASKLLLKFASNIIDPIIVCLQTLKFEPENRKKEEIEMTIPYLKTLDNFKDYVQFQEKEKSSLDLMAKFAKITFYQYNRENTILKRTGSLNDIFYILLNGTIDKYTLVFQKVSVTLEQYLYYLVKLELVNEYEIIKNCHKLNKSIINIGGDVLSISNFFKKNKKFNYYEMQKQAEMELTDLNFDGNFYQKGMLKRVPSIENFLKIFDFNKNVRKNEGKPKINIWLGKYRLASHLMKGQFFSNISDESIKENNIYICKSNCDIGQIDRNKFIENEIYLSIQLKVQKLFAKTKNDFYLFHGIKDEKFLNDYAPFMLYKKFNKGEKICLQGGLYEGVYLILDGEISLTTQTNIDNIGKLLVNIVFSIRGFPEYIPKINSLEIIREFNKRHQVLYNREDIPYNDYAELKNIPIAKYKKYEFIGLNELYDYKTELFNFTAEITSKEATLLFMTKNNFSLMMGREASLYNAVIPIVEYKIQYIAGKLRAYNEQCIKIFTQNITSPKGIKSNSNYNSTTNIHSKNNKSITLNSNKFNNTSYYSTINTNSVSRNKIEDNIMFHKTFFSKEFKIKNKINLNKINFHQTIKYPFKKKNNNEYDISDFQKILNTERLNPQNNEYKNNCLKNNIESNKALNRSKYDSIYESKTPSRILNNESKFFSRDRIIYDYRGTLLNRFIKLNINNDNSTFHNSNSNINRLKNKFFYPSYSNMMKNTGKKKMFPIIMKKNNFNCFIRESNKIN